MRSESTKAFGQPSETNPTFGFPDMGWESLGEKAAGIIASYGGESTLVGGSP